ncbi:alpha-2-macroglobulin [Parabacteroides sp. 52]|nr:alpha-2-macroglobulin family protein [Parabacteroides sp. 52]NDV56388.1 alpha-2-macroglobulin [Parabacteroides sp. 52]
MNGKAIFITVLVYCCLGLIAISCKSTQSADEQKVIKEAVDTRNTPQWIKELIARMKEQLEVDQDAFPSLIEDVENYAAEMPDKSCKALLHSMAAEMYSSYYEQNRWQINRRTPLAGLVPADMRVWTANLFTEKIKEQLALSLQPADLLQHTPAALFQEIMETGKDATTLRATLYDFLMQRAVDIQPAAETYQAWLAFRKTQNDPKAALLVELDYLDYTYRSDINKDSYAAYEAALKQLLNLYESYDFSTEIRIKQVELLDNGRYLSNNPDSVQAVKYSLLQESIAKYPKYERIRVLENALGTMEEPMLSVELANTVYPGKETSVKISYKNIQEVTIRIYESLQNPVNLVSYNKNQQQEKGRLKKEINLRLHPRNTYAHQDTLLQLPMVAETGLYEWVTTVPGKKLKTENTISVSRLAALHRSTLGGGKEVLVTDKITGKPVYPATVNYFVGKRRDPQLAGTVQTDKDGLATLPMQTDIVAFQAVVPGDESGRLTTLYMREEPEVTIQERVNVSLFTDRGLYRPGQTLFFKGIAWVLNENQSRVAANQMFTIILRDANYKEVSTKKVTTNAFGSFHGEFLLPKQGLSGGYTVSAGNFSAYVQVEEYKRPTFALEMQPIKEEIAFGDKVTLQGKVQTFSGVALQGGEVEWRIIRRPFWMRMGGMSNYANEQVANGSTSISPEGTFSVSFVPEKTTPVFGPLQYQNYEIIALATDTKGESQETRYTFSVGDTGMILTTDLPAQSDKANLEPVISARLLNGEKTTATGQFTIVPLAAPEAANNPNTVYTAGKPVAVGTFVSDKALSKNILSSLSSGRYRIYITALDSKGREVKAEQDFVLYAKDDKKPPVFSHTWLIQDKTTVAPGEDAVFTFGTSDKEAYVLYEVFQEKKCLYRKRMVLNDENQLFKIPFKEEYGKGIVASFTFVKKDEVYTNQVQFTREQPDRKLSFRPETFRDRLLPGSEEVWKFKVMDSDSLAITASAAEVLASMYDMSLDKILPFQWFFSPERSFSVQAPWFHKSEGFGSVYQYEVDYYASLPVTEYVFDRLDWQDMMLSSNGFYSMRTDVRGGGARMKSMSPTVEEDAAYADVVLPTGDVQTESQDQMNTTEERQPENAISPYALRTHFNETAFFFPSLITNEAGDVILRFTMPESNTTWKLQAIAHTKDLKYGSISKEVITSKPFMVLPHLPRFLRQGDRVSLSSQLINQSEKAISGKVRLEWFDPATDKPVAGWEMEQKEFTLKANAQAMVHWEMVVPAGKDLLGCRIVADAPEGSDGEQHLLPVLPNRILVTESTPFYLMHEKEKQIEVFQPKKTIDPFRLTLEVSANPVWYAVQALPTMTTPEKEDVLSWFASYYGNTLAASIVQAHPRLQEVIRLWTAQGGDASTLYSNLEKNEELKNILLEETPWVLAAENETAQKQRLSLLFDMNRAQAQRDMALQRLLDQQREDGAWAWFKGFYPNRNMTLAILKGMTQLARLGAVQYNQQEKEMQMRALHYLDETIQKDYEILKKNKTDWEKVIPSAEQLEYLYVRSSYRDIPELGDAREAIRYYTGQAEKNWSAYSLYGRAQIALLMHRNGKKEVSAEIMSWLRKTATRSDEQGMFWANNKRGNDFYTSPIDVHCLLILAFHELSPASQEADRMKQWLLNQKRTQSWETVPATMQAVHAILLHGSDWLNQENTLTVQWGNKTYNTSAGEAATGYIKEVLTGTDISSQTTQLTLHKEGTAPAWGAVYKQYFAPLDQVTAAKTGLHVEKALFVETNNGRERQIRPVTQEQPLRVGDKVIVRLTLRADREMDYVYLKDLRAGCFEPAEQVSGTTYQDGVYFYRSPKDVSQNFFIQRLPKGVFVLEYPVYVSRIGEYAAGISTIQCLYAPEFTSHTEGGRIRVEGGIND